MKILPRPTIALPVSPEIKKHISYYYFFEGENENSCFKFWHYPHYETSLVFLRNADLREDGNVRSIGSINKENHQCIFNQNYSYAKREIVNGKFNIIGIVFRPLGFNHFQHLYPKHINLFSESELSKVFGENEGVNQVKKLDKMFASIYQDFDAPIIKQAIDIIVNRKGDVYLNELSEQLNTSRRTILRNFRAHLNCSFQDFKNVVKFRKAIEYYSQQTQSVLFTDLAYEFNYYDQSDFIKAFKAMTNETPKKFLCDAATSSEKLIWKYDLA